MVMSLKIKRTCKTLHFKKPSLVYKHMFQWDLATKSLKRRGDFACDSITMERASRKQYQKVDDGHPASL